MTIRTGNEIVRQGGLIVRALSVVLFVSVFGVLCGRASAVELVKDGKPVAEIVIDAQAPDATLQFAGRELQLWLEKISGGKLPIVSKVDKARTQIILGTPDASRAVKAIEKKYATDLARMKGNDGFAIRTEGNTIYIFARISKGVLNGVFRLLELNSDIIFVQPLNAENGCGTVYGKRPTFSAEKADCVEIAALGYIRSLGTRNRLWQTRLRNRMVVKDTPQARKKLNHLGIIWSNQDAIIRQTKEGKEHPEFFAVRDGKPQEGWYTQLCYSNEEMIDYYAKRIASAIESTPDDVRDIRTNHSDNNRVCQCEKCMKPITLPDGTIVKPDDPAFRSTAFFRFYNRAYNHAIESLGKPYPDKYLRVFAYLWSAEPPKLRLNKNLMVMFAPYVKSHKIPIYHPDNKPWGDRAEGWMKQHNNIYVYEYYLCTTTPRFYNPVADIAALDLRFYAKSGSVVGMYQDSSGGAEALDASAIEYWVISRLYWDPEQDVEQLREEFCRRAYREAARPMREYYRKIQEVWHKDPVACTWNDNPIMSARRYIVNNNLQDPCRKLLERAESMAVHPGSKELIRRHRAVFEKWLRLEAKATKKVELSVPYRKNVSMESFDFDSGVWKDAAVIDDFRVRKSLDKPAPLPTVVKVINDRDNIYFGITCLKENKALLKKLKGMKRTARDVWPQSPFIELFIDGDQRKKSGYYQLAFNAIGSKYDARGRDAKYNNDKWEVRGHIGGDTWKIILKWPLGSFGRNITMNNRFGMMIYRNTGNSTWLGINVHEPAGFNDLILEMN